MSALSSSKSTLSTARRFGKLFDNYWLDFAVSHFNPLFSTSRTMARVLARQQDTAAGMRIDLEPNGNWEGFVPGQFVPVRISIDGVVRERCYSIISEAGSSTVTIAVKRQENGLVSGYIHDQLRVGDIIELGAAGGEFVLPAELPAKLLFIAGGSGITPVYAMVRQALSLRPQADIVLAFYARHYADFMLLDSLDALKDSHPGLRIQLCLTGEQAFAEDVVGRFSSAQLQTFCADADQRETFVCGPAGLIEAVVAHCAAEGRSEHCHKEYFGLPPVERAADASAEVRYEKAGLTVETRQPTLLQAAEEAGLKPKFGCRMGICNTCTCTKREGVTRNVVTGEIDATPNSQIRICVSEPLSAVTLDL